MGRSLYGSDSLWSEKVSSPSEVEVRGEALKQYRGRKSVQMRKQPPCRPQARHRGVRKAVRLGRKELPALLLRLKDFRFQRYESGTQELIGPSCEMTASNSDYLREMLQMCPDVYSSPLVYLTRDCKAAKKVLTSTPIPQEEEEPMNT
ncbi:hypothetical protein EYF80_027624 [Liparis tanakae]|uniref:Uncharacterized protein n=1 Tax=Liparis tanakae TaxID=230148 RepID=A0A4Z2HB74_9TELE|nr:hypothetical protein EYF80_027624 [Liparis tanakae]